MRPQLVNDSWCSISRLHGALWSEIVELAQDEKGSNHRCVQKVYMTQEGSHVASREDIVLPGHAFEGIVVDSAEMKEQMTRQLLIG